jgi:lysophospholipase
MDQKFAPGQVSEGYVLREAFAQNTLTNDPEMFKMLQTQLTAQPDLVLGGPSLRWLNESLREMRALAQMPSPALLCCTFLGTNETIVDPARIRSRMANWTDGALHMLQDAQHEVMLELPETRTRVFDLATELFDQHG